MITSLVFDETTKFLLFFFIFCFISMILLNLNGDVNYKEKRYKDRYNNNYYL